MTNSPTPTALPQLRISSADHQRLRLLVGSVMKSQPKLRESLQTLLHELDRAEVLAAEIIPASVVVMGSTVEIADLKSGEIDTYTLVYPEQADPANGRISILAPIGTAVIGFSEGDTFTWKTPGGERKLQIRKVRR